MNVFGVPLRLLRPTVEAPMLATGSGEDFVFSKLRKPLPGIKIPALGYPSSLRVGEGTSAPSKLTGLGFLEFAQEHGRFSNNGFPTLISRSEFNWRELKVNGSKNRAFGFSCAFPVETSGSRDVRSNWMGWKICAGSICTLIGSHKLGGVAGTSQSKKEEGKEQLEIYLLRLLTNEYLMRCGSFKSEKLHRF